jgi:hypothetical protein
MGKRKETAAEARAAREEIENSLKVSSRMDEIFEAITQNKPIQTETEDYDNSGISRHGGVMSEGVSPFHMNLADVVSQVGYDAGVLAAEDPVSNPYPYTKTASSQMNVPQSYLTDNQKTAIKKYPALIELLGTKAGDKLAQEIAGHVNGHVFKKVEANTREVCKTASGFSHNKRNIKQYFVGPNEEWVCCVTASGPFIGNEAIFYKEEKDEAYILRKDGDDYKNVTHEFNVVHEFEKR